MQVDFAKLRERVPIEQIAQALNLTTTRHGNQLRCACPACNGDKRTIVITPSKNVFYCFNAKQGGDAISLVAHIKGLQIRDAALWIEQHFPSGGGSQNNSPNNSRGDRAGWDAAKYAAGLDPAHSSLEPLGVDPEVLRGWQAGYAKSGVLRGCLALPATKNGQIIAYFGRAQDGHLTFVNGFNPQDFVFGEDKVEEGNLQLMRDPFEVIKAREAGINAICFLIETITPQMLEMLAALMDHKKCTELEIF